MKKLLLISLLSLPIGCSANNMALHTNNYTQGDAIIELQSKVTLLESRIEAIDYIIDRVLEERDDSLKAKLKMSIMSKP